MNCIIDSTILRLIKRGKGLKVIRRYIRMNYRISIDRRALKDRIDRLKSDFEAEELTIS